MPQVAPEVETFASIKVVGVGGAGSAAINRMVDAGVDSFDFGANVATPISKPKKYSDALGAQVLIKEGVKRYEDLTKNMREAIANHPDAEFASLAKNAALDDEAFKNALFATAKGKGYMDVAQDADELLDLMHNHDQFVKGAGGYTRQEITDLAKWFGNLPLEVRKTGFFDRDAVTDVMDYVQQANQKIAQATMIRSVFKNPELVKKLGEGGEISIYDTWKAAGMTDDGLVTLMAEMKGPGYVNELNYLRNMLDTTSNEASRASLLKELNIQSSELMKFARENGLSSSIAKAVTRTGKVFTGNNESSWLGKLADRLRSITQGGLYVPWPASHIRNRIGGAAINVIADIVSPTAARDAHKLWTGKNLSDPFIKQIVYDALATKLLDSSHPSGFSGTEALEYLKLAIDRPGQFVGGQPVYQGLLDPMRKYGRQVAETYKDSGFKKAAKQAMFGGEMKSGEQATGMFNFWEVRGGISPGDAKAQQGAVNARGKPLDAMDRLKAKETRVLPMQVGEQLGAYIEFQNRMEAFIHLRRQGWDAHTAALKVKEIHFDYSDLNDFEKKVLRRNVLFYDFMRKNLALQANLLFKQPGGKTAQIVRAENRLQEEAKGKDGFIPSHLREGLSIRLPGEVAGAPPGTARYFSQTGLLPIDEAVSRFQFDRSGFPLAIRRTAEKFASQLAPWYSAPIEQFAGKQLSTGRPLKDLYQYPTGDQDVDFWLQKMPTSRLVSTIRSLSDERKGLAQKAFNLTVGGARFTDVNLPVTRMLEGRRAIQENLAGDKDIGTFESLYAKDFTGLVERAKGGDKNALMQLQLYQQLRQGVRELRKQQAGKDAKKK